MLELFPEQARSGSSHAWDNTTHGPSHRQQEGPQTESGLVWALGYKAWNREDEPLAMLLAEGNQFETSASPRTQI